ncbi:hypothetical protein CEXT_70341, partial [Caerostris extrusa]
MAADGASERKFINSWQGKCSVFGPRLVRGDVWIISGCAASISSCCELCIKRPRDINGSYFNRIEWFYEINISCQSEEESAVCLGPRLVRGDVWIISGGAASINLGCELCIKRLRDISGGYVNGIGWFYEIN